VWWRGLSGDGMEGCSVFEMRDSLGGVLGGGCDYVFAEPDWL